MTSEWSFERAKLLISLGSKRRSQSSMPLSPCSPPFYIVPAIRTDAVSGQVHEKGLDIRRSIF